MGAPMPLPSTASETESGECASGSWVSRQWDERWAPFGRARVTRCLLAPEIQSELQRRPRVSLARAATQEEAVAFGDVVLWTPRGVMPVDPDALAGKVVIDPNNRGPGPDGGYASLRPTGPSLAKQLQEAAPRARVVKAFNTVVMRLLQENPERLRKSGAQVFLAGDDAEAKVVASSLAADIGLGSVDLGGLEAAWMAEAMADTFRQAMVTSPAGWRQALVFADLADRPG